jgi:DNA helicase II / ATP-dependent DNA helicase PcrA
LTSAVTICAAGGGKTTRIVGEAALAEDKRTLLVTYTRNNESQLYRHFYGLAPSLPPHVEVMTWFVFLLRELARPYQRSLHNRRIDAIHWVEAQSARYAQASDIDAHYFAGSTRIYSDKIAKFVCEADKKTGGAVMARLKQRFDHIYVDEIQDMAGYDLDILELILKAGITLSLVGDHRQATFRTNRAARNSQYGGRNIINKFEEWKSAELLILHYEQHTHRCHQDNAKLGDSLFPNEPATMSLNVTTTEHDGIFIVPTGKVDEYVEQFQPQALRLDKRTPCNGLSALNFGESKGMTFDRVLIFPHGLGKRWLKSGDISHVEGSIEKMYVGVTRARQSVAFVYDGAVGIEKAQTFG